MSDNQSGSPPNAPGDDEGADSLTSFLFYTLFVYPVCSWILSPGRFSRRSAILYAVSFLAILAALKTGLEVSERGPNYFSLLGVDRLSSPSDIKKGYKLMSLKLHPDKNPSPTANEQFSFLKSASDVLLDTNGQRQTYMKFGAEGLRTNANPADEMQVLLGVGVYYASMGMIIFVLTLGRASADARTWIYTGLIAMLIVEVLLRTSDDPLPAWFFPKTTEHEWAWLLRQLFPAYMNGCRVIGGFLFVDVEKQTRALLAHVLEQQKDVLQTLRDLKAAVQSRQLDRVPTPFDPADNSVSSGALPASASAPPSSSSSSSSSSLHSSLSAVEARMSADGATVKQTVAQLHNDGNKSSGMGFYVLIIAYVVISYAFNKTK